MDLILTNLKNHLYRKSAWNLVAETLQAEGVLKDEQECSRKWNNLMRTYRVSKDNKNKTGRAPIKFDFFDEIDDILGDRDSNKGMGLSIGCETVDLVEFTDTDEIFKNNELVQVQNDSPTKEESSGSGKRKRTSAKADYYNFKKSALIENFEKRDGFENTIIDLEKKN